MRCPSVRCAICECRSCHHDLVIRPTLTPTRLRPGFRACPDEIPYARAFAGTTANLHRRKTQRPELRDGGGDHTFLQRRPHPQLLSGAVPSANEQNSSDELTSWAPSPCEVALRFWACSEARLRLHTLCSEAYVASARVTASASTSVGRSPPSRTSARALLASAAAD